MSSCEQATAVSPHPWKPVLLEQHFCLAAPPLPAATHQSEEVLEPCCSWRIALGSSPPSPCAATRAFASFSNRFCCFLASLSEFFSCKPGVRHKVLTGADSILHCRLTLCLCLDFLSDL